MPPPFWMHCNICVMQYDTSKKFYMMSCQHTLCRDCMKLTGGGKKCPLDKKNINFEEVTRLQEKEREFFQPDVLSVLNKPMKMINFQKQQIKQYMNLVKSYKKKYQKASLMKAEMGAEAFQMNVKIKKYITLRQLMQEKLKQIHRKKTHKNSFHPYDHNLTSFTNSNSIQYTRHSIHDVSNSPGLFGNFYNNDASPITPIIKRTQNSRSPFFV